MSRSTLDIYLSRSLDRLEAAIRLEAIAIRLEAIPTSNNQESQRGGFQSLSEWIMGTPILQ